MRIRCLADNSTTPGKTEALIINLECGKIVNSIEKTILGNLSLIIHIWPIDLIF